MKFPKLFFQIALLIAAQTVDCILAAAPSAPSWLNAPPADVAQWRQWKFGLLISWGPASVSGEEQSWSRYDRIPRFGHGDIPTATYDRLYTKFNPTHYDARQWVDIAKAGGAKYVVFMAKHHDGFANFDTRLGAYKITAPDSPYRKDLVRPLADACHAADMKFGLYYSQPDWHHPDCFTARHDRYLNYYKGQIGELLGNYGKIDILWFDCIGYGGYFGRDARDWAAEAVLKEARRLQPHIIINNRCGVPADFDTPEQSLGACDFKRPWETVMTLAGAQWSWKPNAQLKSRAEVISTLVRCACGDGNLMLGIGPRPDGQIDPPQAERLAEVGQWLKQYGESIYDTRGGPLPTADWGGTTRRGDTVYVHVLKWPDETLVLPPLKGKIVASRLLAGAAKDSVRVEQDEKGVRISVPKSARDAVDTVVALKFADAAPQPEPSGPKAPWHRTKAWEWYRQAAPIVGCNYLPRTAVNSTEMWQAATFDPKTIDQELGWAETAGYNSVRVFLQYAVWKADPEGFKQRLNQFLAIAARHRLRALLVTFDDCAFAGRDPYLGPQAAPVPGVHNSGWVPSPGLKLVADRAAWPNLRRYITDIVGTFGQDDRVLFWDLYNEPGASGMNEKSLPLVEATFDWARAAQPRQPLTMGVWIHLDNPMSQRMIDLSDVVSFHGYDGPEGLEAKIQKLKDPWRPIICTECLAREVGSTFERILPIFARENVGWYNWGLVAGRTQTYIHWGSVKGSAPPSIWQHDVFRADGRPYDPREIGLIRGFSAK